jgi:hypothetical protein
MISSLSGAVWQSDSSITGYSDAIKGVTASNGGVGYALRDNMQYRAPYSSAAYSDAYSESAATADNYCSNASLILPQHDWERSVYNSNTNGAEAKEPADYDNNDHYAQRGVSTDDDTLAAAGGTAGTSLITSESDNSSNTTAASHKNSSRNSRTTHYATHSAVPSQSATASGKAVDVSDVHLAHGIKY